MVKTYIYGGVITTSAFFIGSIVHTCINPIEGKITASRVATSATLITIGSIEAGIKWPIWAYVFGSIAYDWTKSKIKKN